MFLFLISSCLGFDGLTEQFSKNNNGTYDLNISYNGKNIITCDATSNVKLLKNRKNSGYFFDTGKVFHVNDNDIKQIMSIEEDACCHDSDFIFSTNDSGEGILSYTVNEKCYTKTTSAYKNTLEEIKDSLSKKTKKYSFSCFKINDDGRWFFKAANYEACFSDYTSYSPKDKQFPSYIFLIENGLESILKIETGSSQARDGVQIPYILSKPNNKNEHNKNTVLMIHGGPFNKDTYDSPVMGDFYEEFIKKGYQVLRINYRGSTSSYSHFEKGIREWGQKMQTDLYDVLDDLSEKKIIDPENVTCFGFSYGGYAALMALTHNKPENYCKVFKKFKQTMSMCAPTEMKTFLEHIEKNLLPKKEYRGFYLLANSLILSKEKFEELSPANKTIENYLCLYSAHGNLDEIVPYETQFVKKNENQELYSGCRHGCGFMRDIFKEKIF